MVRCALPRLLFPPTFKVKSQVEVLSLRKSEPGIPPKSTHRGQRMVFLSFI